MLVVLHHHGHGVVPQSIGYCLVAEINRDVGIDWHPSAQDANIRGSRCVMCIVDGLNLIKSKAARHIPSK